MIIDRIETLPIPVGPRTPGAYVLRRRGEVVWIGHTKNLLSRLYAHAQHDRGHPLQAGMPRRPVLYDTAEVAPCRLEAIAETFEALCEEHRWAPPS